MTPYAKDIEWFYRDQIEDQFVSAFRDFFSMNNMLQELFWPNYQKAPWHMQMRIGDSVINFWPHKLKAHVSYESTTANGIEEIAALLRRVQEETEVDFDLVEKIND